MNIESMRTRSYRSFKVDDAELSEQARGRLLAIRRFEALRAAGCAEQAALEEIGVSRRTVFRWKAALAARGQRGLEPESTRPRRVRRPSYRPGDAKAVMDLRRKHPFMGKAPIQRMLERKGRRLSVSTVGRILSRAIADGRVPRASVCEGRLQPRRRRKFNGWAQRWKYGARPRRPGQLVQIDHMTFSRDGQTIKEFRAVCPASRFMVARVFSRATAFNARRFLDDVVEALPVPLRSVQVDGGSEFMRHSWRSELRGRMPGARHRTPRPAAAPPAVERLRRTRQPNRPHRVLELPRLRTHRPGRLRQAPPVRVLLQLPAAPFRPRLPHPQRVPCRSGGCLAPVPEVVNQYISLPPGDHLAVVGPSGIGKSSLAALLAGVLVPDRGSVTIGGVPLHQREDRCQLVTMVPQETYVFAGSLRENLCYLRPSATDAEVLAAAQAVGLERVLERLGGLEAEIDLAKSALSAGERQLVTLVRAHLAASPIVVLDEATCHLDPAAEERAERAFMASGSTLVVVAHRMSATLRAKRVLVMGGEGVDVGQHGELLRRNALYSDFHAMWSPSGTERSLEMTGHGD